MKRLQRYLSIVLTLVLIVGLMPQMTLTAKAAKPTLKTSVKMLVGSAKNLSFTTNGYKIISVESESDDETVADVQPYKTKIKLFAFEAGKATIKTVIRAKKGNVTKKFTLKTKVTVPEMKIDIDRPSLTEGEYTSVRLYNVYKKADIVYYSSNDAVATVNNNGVVVAGSTIGSATITAKVILPGNALYDGGPEELETTVKVTGLKNKDVSTQAELENVLRSGASGKITFTTSASGRIIIPNGTYSGVTLVVNAPNAAIENYGVFKTITLTDCNSNNWYERARGNNIVVASTRPVRLNFNFGYDVASVTFSGNCNGTNYVDLSAGNLGNLNVTGATSVNMSVKGSSIVSKISLNPAAVLSTSNSFALNVAGNAAIGTIEAYDMGGSISIGATDNARISDISVNRNNRVAGYNTSFTLTSAGGSYVTTATIGSALVNASITENGSSQITNIRINDGATVSVSGNSTREMFLDLNNDINNATRVTLNTSRVRIECGRNITPTTVIINKSGQPVNALCYDSRGVRYNQTITSTVDNRLNQRISSVTRLSANSIQIILDYADTTLTRNNFSVYSNTYVNVNSVTYAAGGKTYVIYLNGNIYDDTNYTVQISGIDTNLFKNSQVSANLYTGVTGVTLNKTAITKTSSDIGLTEQLRATVTGGGSYNNTVVWSSSNTSVAIVSNSGLVTFRGVGTANITASVGNKYATCRVTVSQGGAPDDGQPAIMNFVGQYECIPEDNAGVYTMIVETADAKDQGKATITYRDNATGDVTRWEITGKFTASDSTLTYTSSKYTDSRTSTTLNHTGDPGRLVFYSANGKARCAWNGAGRTVSELFIMK